MRTIQEASDIILVTARAPPARLSYTFPALVLAVHGGEGDPWTARYTKYAAHYDEITAVSSASRRGVPLEFRNRTSVITAGVSDSRLKTTSNIPFDSKGRPILLFLGRVTIDKNPQFFVDVVNALPDEWIGLIAGPPDFFLRRTERVHFLGRTDHGADVLKLSTAVFCPSQKEGGPIVLLEAWAAKIPFFMRSTGLAVDYPQAVFTINSNNADIAATYILDTLAGDISTEVEAGYEIFRSR